MNAAPSSRRGPWAARGEPAPWLLLLLGVACALHALRQAIAAWQALANESQESGAALAAVHALLLAASAVALLAWPRLKRGMRALFLGPLTPRAALLPLLALLPLAIAIGLTLQPLSWDEAAHACSGLALRGHPTPYAWKRSPVTQLLAGLFFPHLGWLNAAMLLLLGALLAATLRAARAARGWLWLLPVTILANPYLLPVLFGFNSELPAMVAAAASMWLLARGQWALAAVALSLMVLSRWNMAPVAAAVVAVVAWRHSWRAAALMAAIGLAFLLAYAIPLHLLGQDPVATIGGYAASNHHHGDLREQSSPLAQRAEFQLRRWYILGLPITLAAVLSPLFPPRRDLPREWVFRLAIPLALLAYLATMTLSGPIERRLLLPAIPLGLVILAEACTRAWRHGWLPARPLLVLTLALLPLSMDDLSRYPDRLAGLANRLRSSMPLPEEDAAVLRAALGDGHPRILAWPTRPLTSANGHPLMVQLRRTVEFPGVARSPSGDILETQPPEVGQALLAGLQPGQVILLPATGEVPLPPGDVLADTGQWLLLRP